MSGIKHTTFRVAGGVPTGGKTVSMGLNIDWHDSSKSSDKNGAYLSDVIEATRERLEFINDEDLGFNCYENDLVIALLKEAEGVINSRFERRKEQGKAVCEPE